jgi:hypothetical protein
LALRESNPTNAQAQLEDHGSAYEIEPTHVSVVLLASQNHATHRASPLQSDIGSRLLVQRAAECGFSKSVFSGVVQTRSWQFGN